MLLSAVMPVGNFEENSEQILKIVDGFCVTDCELILILDSQSQSTFEFLQSYLKEKRLGNVLIKQSKCKNPGGSRNLGLQFAKGDWIVFWDSDDSPNLNRVIGTIKNTKEDDSDIMIFNYEKQLIFEKNRKIRSKLNLNSVALNPGIWRFAFRKSFIDDISFNSFRLGEDQVFLCKIFARNPIILLSDINVYTYMVGVPNQLTSIRSLMLDLHGSIVETIKIAVDYRGMYNKFIRMILIRQVITGISHGGGYRFVILKDFMSYLGNLDFRSRLLLIFLFIRTFFLTIYSKLNYSK